MFSGCGVSVWYRKYVELNRLCVHRIFTRHTTNTTPLIIPFQVRVTYEEQHKRDWGGFRPKVVVEYDERNNFLMAIDITYNRREADKNLAYNYRELKDKIQHELDSAQVCSYFGAGSKYLEARDSQQLHATCELGCIRPRRYRLFGHRPPPLSLLLAFLCSPPAAPAARPRTLVCTSEWINT